MNKTGLLQNYGDLTVSAAELKSCFISRHKQPFENRYAAVLDNQIHVSDFELTYFYMFRNEPVALAEWCGVRNFTVGELLKTVETLLELDELTKVLTF